MVDETAAGAGKRGDDAATERLLAQIREIVLQARTTSFTLRFLLTFAGITLLDVEHADVYAFGRQTQLPLVGVRIATTSFFWAAPAHPLCRGRPCPHRRKRRSPTTLEARPSHCCQATPSLAS